MSKKRLVFIVIAIAIVLVGGWLILLHHKTQHFSLNLHNGYIPLNGPLNITSAAGFDDSMTTKLYFSPSLQYTASLSDDKKTLIILPATGFDPNTLYVAHINSLSVTFKARYIPSSQLSKQELAAQLKPATNNTGVAKLQAALPYYGDQFSLLYQQAGPTAGASNVNIVLETHSSDPGVLDKDYQDAMTYLKQHGIGENEYFIQYSSPYLTQKYTNSNLD